MTITPGLDVFSAENLRNGLQRPVASPNAWVANYDDSEPEITITWETEMEISEIILSTDCDYDHPMENVLMRHAEAVQPSCVTEVFVNIAGEKVAHITDNHQAQVQIKLATPVRTKELKLTLKNANSNAPVSLFEIRCYA
jgi:hypothetical protein